MRSIEEFARINKIEGNAFVSFDISEMKNCDKIACGSLKLNHPEYILPVLFDRSTNVVTVRYSVPEQFVDVASDESELQIEEVITLYEKILQVLDECEDWFLKPGGLCFELPYIYINQAHDALKFIYIPESNEDVALQDIKHLMISLLEKCKETSGGAIQLQLYKYFYKPNFSVEEFRRMLEEFKKTLPKKQKEESSIAPNRVEMKPQEQEVLEDAVEVKSEEKEQVEEKRTEEIEQIKEMGKKHAYYRPKVYPSQLSQEEIEEMVESIYSGKMTEDKKEEKNQQPELETKVSEQEEVFYGAKNKVEDKSSNSSRRKNLFDNVFSSSSKSQTKSAVRTSARVATLKSISVHTRYDLPKLIEIHLMDDKFIIGRATRTGEPTGANFEFGAEITPISRLHAEIDIKDGAYYLQDLGSSNGTFLNGTKIEANKPYLIEDGDKIAFAIAYSKNSIEYAFVE